VIERLIARYPNNYALHTARVFSLRAAGDFPGAIVAGQQAVRCSPGNPDGWRSLSNSYHQWSDNIRKGRMPDKMSERELQFCTQAYQEWIGISLHNVAQEPGSFYSQDSLSSASLYLGEESQALGAAQAAIQIAPAHPEGYRSMLIACQPQWFNRPEDAATTLRAAALSAKSSEWWSAADRIDVAIYGASCGQVELARALLRTPREHARLDAWIKEEERLQGSP
jgi:hypothetical protein